MEATINLIGHALAFTDINFALNNLEAVMVLGSKLGYFER